MKNKIVPVTPLDLSKCKSNDELLYESLEKIKIEQIQLISLVKYHKKTINDIEIQIINNNNIIEIEDFYKKYFKFKQIFMGTKNSSLITYKNLKEAFNNCRNYQVCLLTRLIGYIITTKNNNIYNYYINKFKKLLQEIYEDIDTKQLIINCKKINFLLQYLYDNKKIIFFDILFYLYNHGIYKYETKIINNKQLLFTYLNNFKNYLNNLLLFNDIFNTQRKCIITLEEINSTYTYLYSIYKPQ